MRTAVIALAGGQGSRMGTLVRHTPKPLLRVAEHPLLDHVLARLEQALPFHEVVITVPNKPEHRAAFDDWAAQYRADHADHALHVLPDRQRGVGEGFAYALEWLFDHADIPPQQVFLTVADMVAKHYSPFVPCDADIAIGVVRRGQDTKHRTAVHLDADGALRCSHRAESSGDYEIAGVYRLSAQAARALCVEFAARLKAQSHARGVEPLYSELGMTWVWARLQEVYGLGLGGVDLDQIAEANTPEALATLDRRLRQWGS